MANRRYELQSLLEDILGSRQVYYQPPTNIQMRYPAIVYSRSDIDNRHANDSAYIQSLAYEVIVIDENPDSDIVMQVSQLPMCNFNRHYESDNLNHDVFTIYF